MTVANIIDVFFDFAIVCQSSRQAMNRRSKELLARPNSNFRRITTQWSCDIFRVPFSLLTGSCPLGIAVGILRQRVEIVERAPYEDVDVGLLVGFPGSGLALT